MDRKPPTNSPNTSVLLSLKITFQQHYPNYYIQSLIKPPTLNSSLQPETEQEMIRTVSVQKALLHLAPAARAGRGNLYSLVPKQHIAASLAILV